MGHSLPSKFLLHFLYFTTRKIQVIVVGKKKCQTTNIKNTIEAFTEQMGLEERKGAHYIFFKDCGCLLKKVSRL